MQSRIATTALALVAVAQLGGISPTLADPVTYNLSETLYDGGIVSGNFTLDAGSLIAFSFTLPVTLPDPVTSPMTEANSYITLNSLPDIQIESLYYTGIGPTGYDVTILNFHFDTFPVDSNPVPLGYSSLLQAQYAVGADWDYIGGFLNTTVSLASVPGPRPTARAGLPRLLSIRGFLRWARPA